MIDIKHDSKSKSNPCPYFQEYAHTLYTYLYSYNEPLYRVSSCAQVYISTPRPPHPRSRSVSRNDRDARPPFHVYQHTDKASPLSTVKCLLACRSLIVVPVLRRVALHSDVS